MRALLGLLSVLLAAPLGAQSALEIRFFNVGQGDAVLVRESGKSALIDAGPGSGAVIGQLRALGVDTLDIVIASHNHADHIGGMPAVIGGSVARFYMDNGLPTTTSTYQRTMAAVRASGAQYLNATTRSVTLGYARLRIMAPPPGVGDQNNSSVGVRVDYGDFHAILTGDSEQEELAYWLQHAEVPRVQVVKVAHHGSPNGTSQEWINATRPGVAVISVGRVNGYGHPSLDVIAAWEAAGARVYRTDITGSVVILAHTNGQFSVTTASRGVAQSPRTRAPAQRVTPTAPPGVPQPRVSPPPAAVRSPNCCKVCSAGQACGNSCISRRYQCHKPPGCACNAQ